MSDSDIFVRNPAFPFTALTTISGTGHMIDLTSNSTDNASANFLSTDWSIKLVNGNAGILTNMASEDIAEDTP